MRYDTSSQLAAAPAAKSLQSCLTLCDPIDGSPPGSVPFTLHPCLLFFHGQGILSWARRFLRLPGWRPNCREIWLNGCRVVQRFHHGAAFERRDPMADPSKPKSWWTRLFEAWFPTLPAGLEEQMKGTERPQES